MPFKILLCPVLLTFSLQYWDRILHTFYSNIFGNGIDEIRSFDEYTLRTYFSKLIYLISKPSLTLGRKGYSYCQSVKKYIILIKE